MKPHYLYKITNTINGKMYVGITADPKRRKNQHFNKRKYSAISIVKQAIDKYGKESFLFEVICVGSKDYIAELEVKAIDLYRTREKKFGYNIKPGGEKGRGYAIKASKRDTFQYVSGFWFPNVRTASTATGISKSVIKTRRKKGTLGNVQHNHLKSDPTFPIYVGGFWWENLHQASSMLNVSLTTLRSRVTRGTVEQGFVRPPQHGEHNFMYGIDPKDHPSSKAVIIFGVTYNSIKEATAATGHSKYIITTRIKEGHPDFSYLKEE